MTLLIFGKDGQVGKALQSQLKEKLNITFLGRRDCDLSDLDALNKLIYKYQPQIIINASGYTAVDKAQAEATLAFTINCYAPKIMAQYIASQVNGLLIHYSTDYVFSDSKQTPYNEDDGEGPIEQLGIYAQSKLSGEKAITETFSQANISSSYYILRASWVYGDGNNFIKTILRLAQEREILNIVDDQVGAPTSANFLASLTDQFLWLYDNYPNKVQSGIYHAVPDGHTSWHGLACFVIKLIEAMGVNLKLKLVNVLAVTKANYSVRVPRPHNSRLSNAKLKKYLATMQDLGQSSLQLPTWEVDVEKYVRSQLIHLNRFQNDKSTDT